MSTVTTLPTWAVYLIGFGTPASAFVGVVIGQFFSRKGAKELERRSRREEALRTLRWAAELAVDKDERRADLGVVQLSALVESDLLDDTEKVFVDATLNHVVEDPAEALEALGPTGDAVHVDDLPSYSESTYDEAETTPEGS